MAENGDLVHVARAEGAWINGEDMGAAYVRWARRCREFRAVWQDLIFILKTG